MKKNLLLIFSLILLITNILYIGLLKYNEQNVTELFIKHKPSLVFNFSSENKSPESSQLYKEFVTQYNIENKSKSFLPLILIQLMLSGFILSRIETDFKRKTVLYLFHFVICLVGFFQVIVIAFNQNNKFITILILSGVVIGEILIMKLFAPKKSSS